MRPPMLLNHFWYCHLVVWEWENICGLVHFPVHAVQIPYTLGFHTHHAYVIAARVHQTEQEVALEPQQMFAEAYTGLQISQPNRHPQGQLLSRKSAVFLRFFLLSAHAQITAP